MKSDEVGFCPAMRLYTILQAHNKLINEAPTFPASIKVVKKNCSPRFVPFAYN